MEITLFEISQDGTTLNLTLTDASSATSLLLWTDSTFKDPTKAEDFSAKLTGGASQNITISLADIGIPFFDGVYFIQLTSSTDATMAATADLTRYKECILNKVLQLVDNNDCLVNTVDSTLTAQTLLSALSSAILYSFIDEILIILKALQKYCSETCKSCGEYKNIVDIDYYP